MTQAAFKKEQWPSLGNGVGEEAGRLCEEMGLDALTVAEVRVGEVPAEMGKRGPVK